MIEVGSDFSGVGAFNQALIRLGIDYKEVFACEMDKFARKTFIHNYGEPEYYPENVYDRKIPEKPLEIYSSTPPCQGFSLAGKREGSILFYNTLEFIKNNKPRFFILENVKGLLSHDSGKTFYEWEKSLGGKSINGHKDFFTREDAAPYHIYWKVLNAKEHGVPQNRERVFIVGIRDDKDNSFSWPNTEPLTKRLKDVLETEVDPKYFLSKKAIHQLLKNNIETDHLIPGDVSNTIRVGGSGSISPKHSFDMISDGYQIRRLTPRECFRLMDFPDTFTWTVSDSQAYKQAGNSVVVKMYELIIAELLKINR